MSGFLQYTVDPEDFEIIAGNIASTRAYELKQQCMPTTMTREDEIN